MVVTDEAISELSALVSTYEKNKADYHRSDYNETSLRVEYLNHFFKLLGWDVDNEQGRSIYTREVIHESNVKVEDEGNGNTNKKPDYAFRISGETKFFVEAKKPSVNILTSADSSFQARRYGWSANHRIVVLSNFEDTSIYDCSYKPTKEQEPSFARIAHYHYDELLASFDHLTAILSKDAVLNGSLDTIAAKEAVKKEPFDDFFLTQIRNWRYEIAKDIFERYDNVGSAELNRFTQNIIDRIIFLRVCEDRSFEEPNLLLNIPSFSALKSLFARADKKYNSGLFDYPADARWEVSAEVLANIFKDLYYPNSSYQFNVVQPHVIGQIYEQFLGEKLVVDNGWILFEPDAEITDADGVVSTPKEITDIIVAETLEGRSMPCRVADICCGSGNFLLSAYEFLAAKELDRMTLEDPHSLVERQSGLDLPFSRKREILTGCIFGVDINPLAVEVAKLSLQLRLLEGCNSAELNAYMEMSGNKILPDLSANIKCGNSIVGTDYFDFDPSAASDIQKLRMLRPFNWDTEFSPCKFDAIVGNPPYIRVQNMKKHRKLEYDYVRSGHCALTTTKVKLVDKYQIFIEQALLRLTNDGTLGMIVPNKFLTIDSGKPLRSLLSSTYNISKLIDFGANQVFSGHSTYTCIFVATPRKLDTFLRQEVKSLPHFISSPSDSMQAYPSSVLGAEPWYFLPPAITDRFDAIKTKCSSLKTLAEVFVGLQTSKDDAYIFEPKRQEGNCYVFDSILEEEACVETYLCRPCVLDVAFEPYAQLTPNRMLIYPYEIIDGKASLIPLSRLKEEAPHAYDYFKSLEKPLKERAMKPVPTEETWHRFGRSQSLNRFAGKPHIVWTVMALVPKYEIDYSGQVMFTGGGNGPYYGLSLKTSTPESIEYILAVLCYWLTEALVKYRTSVFGGAYYSHGKQFVEVLPVRRINFDDPLEAAKHAEITSKVKQLTELIRTRNTCTDTDDKTLYGRSISAMESAITRIMDSLYEIDDSIERPTFE